MAYTAQDWTISGLSVELGMDRRTLGKYLSNVTPCRADDKTQFYRMADVFRAFVEAKTGTGDPQKEKARLDKLRADQIEMDMAVKRGEYLPVTLLESAIGDFAGQALALFESLPKRIRTTCPELPARAIAAVEKELVKGQQAIADIRLGGH